MAKDILMPLLSPSMTEGTLVKWLKKEGDAVKSGDVLAEVETDKATMDLEAFDSGILRKILIQEGAKVPVQTRIGIIGTKDEKIDESAPAAPAAAPAAERERSPRRKDDAAASAAATATAAPTAPAAAASRLRRLAKKIAAEKGVNLAALTGTGPGGRIVKEGRAQRSRQRHGPGRRLLDLCRAVRSRRKAARSSPPCARSSPSACSRARRTIPHFYLEIEVDAKPLLDLRAQLNDSLAKLNPPVKLSLNDFVLKAAAEAVRRVPAVNASFEGDSIRQFPDVQLSFAVAIAEGLITPIIKEAQNKSLIQISGEAKALAAKAKEGKLKPEEFQGGTFTVSNLGMLGIDRFSAIINPPQAAILAIGNIVKKPVVGANDEIVVGHRQSITLSCDHRVVDGAVGAAYLKELRELIEKPALLLL